MDVAFQTLQQINVENVEGVTVVTFRDQKIIEDKMIREVGHELLMLLEENIPKKLLLDFSGILFISTTFLGWLMRLQKECAGKGFHLHFCSIIPGIYEVFEITKLHRLFSIHPDRETALAAF